MLVYDLERHMAFSEKTFGPGARHEGIIDHIKKELKEVAEDPSDLEEWIDLVMLALDGAWRSRPDDELPSAKVAAIQRMLYYKQMKNEARDWPDWRTVPPGKAVEHIR